MSNHSSLPTSGVSVPRPFCLSSKHRRDTGRSRGAATEEGVGDRERKHWAHYHLFFIIELAKVQCGAAHAILRRGVVHNCAGIAGRVT
jgi:hypothetical protein